MISMIVAVGANREIGLNGTMPWHLPEDLQHFKEITMKKPMIMGKKTFQSLPGVLPGRQHYIVTRDPSFIKAHPRVHILHDLQNLLTQAKEAEDEYMIIGGGQIYAQAMPLADRLYLTYIHKEYPEADTFFPEIDPAVWTVEGRSPLLFSETQGLTFEYVTYCRK